jgi:hypothetical protein
MERLGIREVISFDTDFDGMAGIERIDFVDVLSAGTASLPPS